MSPRGRDKALKKRPDAVHRLGFGGPRYSDKDLISPFEPVLCAAIPPKVILLRRRPAADICRLRPALFYLEHFGLERIAVERGFERLGCAGCSNAGRPSLLKTNVSYGRPDTFGFGANGAFNFELGQRGLEQFSDRRRRQRLRQRDMPGNGGALGDMLGGE